MGIAAVHILPTNKTPEVFLNPEGSVKIIGRAIDESRTKFSEQILIWIDDYLTKPAVSTEVIIALEYMNSFNSIIMASILRKLYQLNELSKKISIKWYVEEDDDDLLERGEYISTTFNIPIEFIKTDQIKSSY
ncbi:MAG: DUF1987 family protein [Bacteroidales bacterium]|nr:DUF1987 family protein [Bacteroidales bacterium]MBK7626644.1 DUF1987 family protein [Bacteroidales bacterium]